MPRLDLDLGETCPLRGQADVGCQRELEAYGQADAVDGADERLVTVGCVQAPRVKGAGREMEAAGLRHHRRDARQV